MNEAIEPDDDSPPTIVRGRLDLDAYRVADLHARLGFKKQTIQGWIKDGKLRGIDFGGSAGYLVLHRWLIEFFEAGGPNRPPQP